MLFCSRHSKATSPDSFRRERGDAFSAEMSKRGIDVVRVGPECVADQNKLTTVLLECEKPACVLAAYDDTAATVLSICRRAGLKIPEDVAVLGIGNDEDVCLHTVPPLSSVQPDFEEEGYRASRELQSMMLGDIPKKRLFFCGRSMVVGRSSTRNSTNSAMLSHDAMSFISRNALRGISAKDVTMHLHVSRRLADLRFREATGTSLQKAIIEKRLKEVCRLLADSTLTISEIAVWCGYRDANYLKNLFRKRTGMSMREWRRQGRA
jgi:LacI family transcriptional regulator